MLRRIVDVLTGSNTKQNLKNTQIYFMFNLWKPVHNRRGTNFNDGKLRIQTQNKHHKEKDNAPHARARHLGDCGGKGDKGEGDSGTNHIGQRYVGLGGHETENGEDDQAAVD